MYFLETRHPSGKLNNIEIIRLKNKLGKTLFIQPDIIHLDVNSLSK